MWDSAHQAATEAIALGRHGRHLSVVGDRGHVGDSLPGLDLGDGDYHVAVPDLQLLETIAAVAEPGDPKGDDR